MAVPYKLTTDGFETHWQTNQLAPHLLFTTLLPILRSTASTSASKDIVRVVNVSSDAAFLNSPKELNYQDPNLTSTTGAMAAWYVFFPFLFLSNFHPSPTRHFTGNATATPSSPPSFTPAQSTTVTENEKAFPHIRSTLVWPRRTSKPPIPHP